MGTVTNPPLGAPEVLMPRRSHSLALFFLLLVAPLAAAPPAGKPKETAKYGVYLQNSRIGSMTTASYDVTWEKKPALRMDSDTDVKLQALGTTVEQKLTMTHTLDAKGSPLYSKTVISSMGRVTEVEARYYSDRVVCNLDAGGQKSVKTVEIPKGVTLVGDPQQAGTAKELKVGDKEVLHFFEPMTLTIQKVTMEVLKKDLRTVGGKRVPAYLLKSSNSVTGTSQTWVDGKGKLLEDNNALGLRLVREDVAQEKTALSYEPPKDFAVATSVITAVKIAEPRKAGTLRLKITGIPGADLVLSDTRQQVLEKQGTDAVTATYLIQARELPANCLPASPGAAGTADAPYLGLADPTIQRQAKEIAAGETNRGVLARRIRAWVKGHMQKPNNVGTPRSAAEIMKSRDGVCRDYATLFTALARAAGVPTRIASGIVYFQNGFFYHAWVECQLTDAADGWYAFDPTLDTDFVDATHVKFAQGEPSEMFAAVRAVGQIKAEILEHK
jgi:transglutaminase-like putative cysteine protease